MKTSSDKSKSLDVKRPRSDPVDTRQYVPPMSRWTEKGSGTPIPGQKVKVYVGGTLDFEFETFTNRQPPNMELYLDHLMPGSSDIIHQASVIRDPGERSETLRLSRQRVFDLMKEMLNVFFFSEDTEFDTFFINSYGDFDYHMKLLEAIKRHLKDPLVDALDIRVYEASRSAGVFFSHYSLCVARMKGTGYKMKFRSGGAQSGWMYHEIESIVWREVED